MTNKYEMVTVKSYIESLDVKYTSVKEEEISAQVEKYLLNVRRSETNAKIVEALLA